MGVGEGEAEGGSLGKACWGVLLFVFLRSTENHTDKFCKPQCLESLGQPGVKVGAQLKCLDVPRRESKLREGFENL